MNRMFIYRRSYKKDGKVNGEEDVGKLSIYLVWN